MQNGATANRVAAIRRKEWHRKGKSKGYGRDIHGIQYTHLARAVEESQMVHMRVERQLLKGLDDFRFKHRFQSRSEAARWLLEWALQQKPKPEGKSGL